MADVRGSELHRGIHRDSTDGFKYRRTIVNHLQLVHLSPADIPTSQTVGYPKANSHLPSTSAFGLSKIMEAMVTKCIHCICLTSVTRVKCGVRPTMCWKIANISGSTKLFGLQF